MIALEQKPASVLISVVGPGAVVVVNKAGGRYYKDENGSLGSLRAFTKKNHLFSDVEFVKCFTPARFQKFEILPDKSA